MTSEKRIVWGSAAAVVIAAGAIYYFGYVRHKVPAPAPAPATQPAAPPPATAAAPPAPAIEHPVPAAGGASASQPSLPGLGDSDKAIVSALLGVSGAGGLAKLLIPQNVIRHIVATVDNLPRRRVAVEVRPVQPTAGSFMVSGTPGNLTLDPRNYARYAPFVDLVKAVDAKALVAVYFHYYRLFQQAYEDLGYPTEYFNDRVIQVIDHLLATPDVQGPIALTQPNVMYEYADPKLEALSAGQKTLIRMGPANAAVVEGKLREIRQLLATRPPAPAAAPPAGSASGASRSASQDAPATSG
jgi:Protein of unknown function (DUF3014)